MTTTQNERTETSPPPHAQLIQMAMGNWVSQILHVAARLGLADHLAAGRKSADELAGVTGTHAPSLFRLMRTLAHLGILDQDGANRFGLTPLGEALKTGAPGSAHLRYSVETGKSGFEKSLGMPIFEWLARNPQEASMFSETMVGFHGEESPAVAAAYDFSDLPIIIDV